MEQFREEVDVLFVPMSFEPEDQVNMQSGFPSKLSDCTAVGLPLLIYGPEYCSVVRWARENPGVAEVVVQPTMENLASAVQKLAASPELRRQLGTMALAVGEKLFAHHSVRDQFHRAIQHQ
jgi:hypothetical protein